MQLSRHTRHRTRTSRRFSRLWDCWLIGYDWSRGGRRSWAGPMKTTDDMGTRTSGGVSRGLSFLSAKILHLRQRPRVFLSLVSTYPQNARKIAFGGWGNRVCTVFRAFPDTQPAFASKWRDLTPNVYIFCCRLYDNALMLLLCILGAPFLLTVLAGWMCLTC